MLQGNVENVPQCLFREYADINGLVASLCCLVLLPDCPLQVSSVSSVSRLAIGVMSASACFHIHLFWFPIVTQVFLISSLNA